MKKFANVFELLDEAVQTGTIVEVVVVGDKYPSLHLGVWEPLKPSRTLSELYSDFANNRLRLKPKFKTVEGYVVLTPGTPATSTHLGVYALNPFVYTDKECPPARRTVGDIIAKITFEVEE